MPVQSSPIPTAEKGRYAFAFPIRPGETRFQITYHLDYSGKAKLTPRVAAATANFAVMLPKAMQFKPGPSTQYTSVQDDPNAQTFLARNVSPTQPLDFELSGSGQMPRETQAGENGAPAAQGGSSEAQAGAPASATTDTRPGGGLGTPGEAPDPLKKYRWWIVAGIAIIFVCAAALMMRKPSDTHPSPDLTDNLPARRSGSLLDALKEELFALETERLEGKLNENDYAEQKTALEIVLRRALSRQRNAGYVA
jgi:hypothetical protein